MNANLKLLCWDQPLPPGLRQAAEEAARELSASCGPLKRFWVWVEGGSHTESTVRLVLQRDRYDGLLPVPIEAESTAMTPEVGFRKALDLLNGKLTRGNA